MGTRCCELSATRPYKERWEELRSASAQGEIPIKDVSSIFTYQLTIRIHAAHCNTNALIWYRVRKIQRAAVLMASESFCSAVPQHQCSPKLSGQDGSEIELLKNRVAELEKKIDENRNEVRQLMAELETLQRTIGQQVEPVQNEIQPQVSLYKQTVL